MEKEHLHLLIHEELYLLPEDGHAEAMASEDTAEKVPEVAPVLEAPAEQAAEQKTEPTAQAEAVETSPSSDAEEEANEESPKAEEETEAPPQESPHIPHHDLPETKVLPFAVFHESHDPAENQLLHKIIDACQLQEGQYKIFSQGFDPDVQFEKALVFVPKAKAFYEPIPYKNSTFLCSRPLSVLAGNPHEKVQLWEALKAFVL